MTLTLRVVSLNDLPLTQPLTAHFGAQGGTIGRADHNTMALPDPERHISRQQAEILRGENGFVIRNIGSANPITVQGQPLEQGQSCPLAHGDHVRIGAYLLEVIDETVARSNASVSTVMERASERTAPSPSATAQLPDDFDPFAPQPAPRPAPSPPSSAALGGGAFDDLVPGDSSRSIDDLFGLQPGERDPLADFMAGPGPTSGFSRERERELGVKGTLPATSDRQSASNGLSVDPLGMFGTPEAPRPTPAAPTVPDHTPALHSAFQPPQARVCAEPAPAAPTDNTKPGSAVAEPCEVAPVAAAGETAALWHAFCEGAGIRLDPPQGLNPELMRLMGELLRTAVEGSLQLMHVRAATKQELRAEVTVIQSRNNNPLKFSPDAQSALEQLLQPPVRGFLPGPAAMADAMQDLVGHALGSMVGMRAALEGVLARFRPQALESKLVGHSMLDSVLPLNRKAKLWELYLQHFEAIREEAQEDFHTLFGRAFLAAYEEQLQRLHERKSAA